MIEQELSLATHDTKVYLVWMLNSLNKSAKEYTDFDRFMRKYFSFYKHSFTLKYTPIVNGYGFFDKFMYKYFSFYK